MVEIDEFTLIDRYFRTSGGDPDVWLGIGDDAAILAPSEPIAVATDTLVVGRHFHPTMSAAAIGYRALIVNLSDMAAMGAVPRWFTLALTLERIDPDWLSEFAGAIHACARRYSVSLVGGDTTRGPLTITIQIIGLLPQGRAMRRSGAVPGQDVYVTGNLGDAAAGLQVLSNGTARVTAAERALIERFEKPLARVSEGLALRDIATAAIDISDGLVADLGHLCAASRCGAVIDIDRLPLSEALLNSTSEDRAIELALTGGDDYELCFTANPADAQRIVAALNECGTAAHRIGATVDGGGVRCLRHNEEVVMRRPGYTHF